MSAGLAAVDDRPPAEPIDLRVSLSPQSSVFGLVRALGGEGDDVPVDIRRATLRQLNPRLLARSLWPFRHCQGSWAPDCVAPWWVEDVSVARFGDWLRSCGGPSLQRDVLNTDGEQRADWEPVAARPGDWLAAFAGLSTSVWATLEPLWRARSTRMDAELRRIGLAQVRGASSILLNNLHPRIGFDDGTLTIGCSYTRRVPLAGRTLNLVPMIAGSSQILVHSEMDDVVTVAYALPDSLRTGAVAPQGGAGHDGLAVVVGVARAAILRLVETPRTMGVVAQRVGLAPSTVSHHCDLLENSGLISRQRAGQVVRAVLTPRGAAVIDLLS